MHIEQVEFNTIITFVGMICAMVQGMTGFYAAYYKKKSGMIKANDALFRAHRAFGSFATMLYMLGLFAGINGLVGGLVRNEPPLELNSPSYNFHTWGSFVVLIIWVWKTWLSYFKKRPLYGKRKWLGIALFLAWSYNWITAAISYYLRTLPNNLQHPPPNFLLPYEWLWLQLLLPFVLGALISWFVLKAAEKIEAEKAAKVAARKAALAKKKKS